MIDFEIDCQTFLRLTGTSLGESDSGLYVVDPTGVRAWQGAPHHGELDARWGRGHVDALRLDFIRDAELPFPATGHELLAWQKKNTEFSLPDWFQEVIAARDFGEAITRLARSYSEHRERHDAKALELARLKVARAKPAEWYPVEVEINQQLGTLKAIDDITSQAKTARRDDLIGRLKARGLDEVPIGHDDFLRLTNFTSSDVFVLRTDEHGDATGIGVSDEFAPLEDMMYSGTDADRESAQFRVAATFSFPISAVKLVEWQYNAGEAAGIGLALEGRPVPLGDWIDAVAAIAATKAPTKKAATSEQRQRAGKVSGQRRRKGSVKEKFETFARAERMRVPGIRQSQVIANFVKDNPGQNEATLGRYATQIWQSPGSPQD